MKETHVMPVLKKLDFQPSRTGFIQYMWKSDFA